MKKYFNKYTVTSLFFIMFIMIIGGVTYINNARSLYHSLRDESSLTGIIADIDDVFSKDLFGFQNFIEVYSMSELALDKQLFDDAAYGYLIKDNNGLFHFPYREVDVSVYAKKMIDFSEELSKRNIPLLYVQAPNKKLKNYTVYPAGAYNFANENADSFLKKITEAYVDSIDLRTELENDNLDKSQLFYVTDHHWTTKTAFWAFDKIAEKLNNDYDFNIDSYYTDINNYKLTEYKECFLGSIGRRLERFITGVDDYTFIEPNFDTNYEVYYPLYSTELPFKTGNFMNAIACESILNNDNVDTNRHAAYFEYDYGNLIIYNKMVDNDKKILVIKDSFALPTVAFLSTGVGEIHLVDLRVDGAPIISEYINENDFDAVIVLYNTEVFADPMFNFN